MGGNFCVFLHYIGAMMIAAVTITCRAVFITFTFVVRMVLTCNMSFLLIFQLGCKVIGGAMKQTSVSTC